jgi:xyloglucan-specific exo-beta-1,4-glucanase
MPYYSVLAVLVAAIAAPLVDAASQAYTWKNVKIGGGGGFVPGIVFNPKEQVAIHAVLL